MKTEEIELAYGERVPADMELRGLDGLARAWGYKSDKGVQYILRKARQAGDPWNRWLKRIPRDGTKVQPGDGATGTLNDGTTYLVPAWYAMELYKRHVLELKLRSPHTPTTGGKPGTHDYGRPVTFDTNLDERLRREYEQECERDRREYECYELGDYTHLDCTPDACGADEGESCPHGYIELKTSNFAITRVVKQKRRATRNRASAAKRKSRAASMRVSAAPEG